jgi:hypothetical protein
MSYAETLIGSQFENQKLVRTTQVFAHFGEREWTLKLVNRKRTLWLRSWNPSLLRKDYEGCTARFRLLTPARRVGLILDCQSEGS